MSGASNPVLGLFNLEPDDDPVDRSGEQSQPRKKRAVMDESTPTSTEGGASAVMTDQPLNTTTEWNTGTYVFTHHRIFSSLGYQFSNLTASTIDVTGLTSSFYTTPLARIPCHGIPFYMTRSEFNTLPMGSQVTRCTVAIQPLGYRIPFTTNSASISAVNNATIVLGASAHGLMNKFGGNNYTYASTANDPMIPTSLTTAINEAVDTDTYWGPVTSATQGSLSYSKIPGCFGREMQLKDYYTFECMNIDGGEGIPNIMDEIKLFKMTPYTANSQPITWEYRPQVCVLKPVYTRLGRYQYKIDDSKKVTQYTTMGVGWKLRAPYRIAYNPSSSKHINFHYDDIKEFNHGERPSDSTFDHYNVVIEHSGITSRGYSEYGGSLFPPSLHVGCLPCNTFITTETEGAIANIVALWSVKSTIEVKYSTQFTDPNLGTMPWNAQTLSNWNNIQLGNLPINIRGMRGAHVKVDDKGIETVNNKK